MKAWLLILGVVGSCRLADKAEPRPPQPPQPPASPESPPQSTPDPVKRQWTGVARGVAWDSSWEDRSAWYGTPRAEAMLDHLVSLGGDWIAVTPFSFQRDIHAPAIDFRPRWSSGLTET